MADQGGRRSFLCVATLVTCQKQLLSISRIFMTRHQPKPSFQNFFLSIPLTGDAKVKLEDEHER